MILLENYKYAKIFNWTFYYLNKKLHCPKVRKSFLNSKKNGSYCDENTCVNKASWNVCKVYTAIIFSEKDENKTAKKIKNEA